MKIVVTGGLGFIGHNLCNILLVQGHDVIAVDDLRFVTEELYRQRNIPGIYKWLVPTDCCRHDFNPEHAADADVVIHLACHPNQAAFEKAGLKTAWSNTTVSTSVMQRWAIKQRAKFIYVSSSMVYGNWQGRVAETAELAPVNDYGRAKMFCELAVQEAAHDWVIVRPTAVYGPGDNPNRLITKWIQLAKAGEDLYVSDADQSLDFTHVYDLCRGISHIIQGDVTQQIYNISHGASEKLLTAAELIVRMTNSSSDIIVGKGNAANMPSRDSMDISKAEKELYYRSAWDLTNGLDDVIASMDRE
jgi:nucleoside-diphosphate-sugar epimerase